ncbi:MAG: antitoxin VapB family protein [Candidatus Methanoperedenaceae archaeon]|nr:antitoxin VapB family protein [Candidatus Methanoperedenaceae archaeon]
MDGEGEGEVKVISIRVEDLIFNESILVFMERTIAVSDDVYRGLLRMRSNRSFSEILSKMIWRKGNLKTLEIGFGTRDSKEKDILKTEIKNVEEEFQKWI